MSEGSAGQSRAFAAFDEPPRLMIAGMHLAVLWSFAVAKPLFDVLAGSPDFFVARGNESVDIVIFAAGLLLLPPLAALVVEWLAGLLWRPLRSAIHLLLVAALVAALVLQVLAERVDVPAGALLAVALLAGLGVAIAYARFRFPAAVLSVLGVAPVLFGVIFLLISPVSKLVLSDARAEPASGEVAATNPVVVVVFDELPTISLLDRTGGIDRSRFPNFAEFADTASWYRNATTVADVTTRAVPAILTGSVPEPGALPIVDEAPDNLFTLFGGNYELEASETSTALCPDDLCSTAFKEGLGPRLGALVADLSVVSAHQLLPASLSADLPAVTETFEDFAGDGLGADAEGVLGAGGSEWSGGATTTGGRLAPFRSMLPRIDGSERSLYFTHLSIPHVPWEMLPGGARYAPPAVEPFGFEPDAAARWGTSRPVIRHAQQRHLLQLGLADRLLGSLIERLREEGVWDRALVAVVADHGASFLPGTFRRVATEPNLATIANVPMLVKAPGQRHGRVVDARTRTIDLLPTIARELGVQLPFEVEGEPAPRRGAAAGVVTVHSHDERLVSAPLSRLVRARDRIARRQARSLGAGRGWGALYRAGPHAGLIGSRVGKLTLAGGSAGELQFDRGNDHLQLAPDAGSVPALISGALRGPDEPGLAVAVAVNGRVAAIGTTYAGEDGARMVAMVPPGAYRVGENTLSAFTVLPGGRLQRIDVPA
jgi:hypothetical protein